MKDLVFLSLPNIGIYSEVGSRDLIVLAREFPNREADGVLRGSSPE